MPQKILGSSARQLNDINLAKGKEGVGDSLSVHLSQDPSSAAIWRLQVFVHIDQGTYYLGEILTTPPTLGNVPSRTVLIATCPAATGWKVIATCPTDGEEAYLDLDSSKCCTAAIGVVKIEGDGGTVNDDPWLNNFSTALSASFVVLASPGVVRSATVRLDSTAPTGVYYLQVFNAAALPADGTVVTLANGLLAPVKVNHISGADDLVRIDYNEKGVRFSSGTIIVLSTTEFTKTISGDFISVLSAEYRLP